MSTSDKPVGRNSSDALSPDTAEGGGILRQPSMTSNRSPHRRSVTIAEDQRHEDHALRRNRTLSASPIRRHTENEAVVEQPAESPGRLRRRTTSSRPTNLSFLRDGSGSRGPPGQSLTRRGTSASVIRRGTTPSLARRGTVRPREATLVERRPSLVLVPEVNNTIADGQSIAGFSLAGPVAPMPAVYAPYVEPGYHELNPAYEQPANNRPVWSLAKPLPHVIRPGMRPTNSELHEERAALDEELRQQQGELDPDVEKGLEQEDPSSQVPEGSTSQRKASQRRGRAGSRASAFSTAGKPPSRSNTKASDKSVKSPLSARPPAIEETNASDNTLEPVPELPSHFPSLDSLDETAADSDHSDNGSAVDPTDDELANDGWLDAYGEAEPLRPFNAAEEVHNFHTNWSVIRAQYREQLAEFLGTFLVNLIGICSDLAVTTSTHNTLPSGNETTTDWAWGLATMLGIYVAGGVSGAHLNPAISIMLWIHRGFPMRKVFSYSFAQFLGAFLAALVAYGLYHTAIVEFSAGSTSDTTSIVNSFITGPRFAWINSVTAFFNEFVATAVLAGAVLALGDDSNAPPGAGMNALIVGLVIVVLSMAFGYNTGAAMNPVRDFGPRLALLCVGYGPDRGRSLFRNAWWFYGPWAATITGALFGSAVYDIAIFIGGESPINYPKRRIKRATKKWKRRWAERFRKVRGKKRSKAADGGGDYNDGLHEVIGKPE